MSKELEKDLNNILNQQMKYDNPKTVSQDKWDSLNNIKQTLIENDNRIKELEEEISDRKETEQSLSQWVINLQSKLDEIKEVVYGGFQREEIEDKIKSILKENE